MTPSPPPATCVDLQLRTCSDAAYNRTAFPTPLAHRSREAVEASPEYVLLSVLHHLLEGQCNPDLRLLGCAVLAPRCEGGRAPRACRRVCEGLREACLPAFDAIDMAWPYFLDCGRYFGDEQEGCYDPLEKLRGEHPAGGGGRAGSPLPRVEQSGVQVAQQVTTEQRAEVCSWAPSRRAEHGWGGGAGPGPQPPPSVPPTATRVQGGAPGWRGEGGRDPAGLRGNAVAA